MRFRQWITQAEEEGVLHRIDAEVDWDEEMGAITHLTHREDGAPALLFENVKDYPDGFRVLFNMFAKSTVPIALMMNEDPDLSKKELIQLGRNRFNDTISPEMVSPDEAPVYENTDEGGDVDLFKFPAPKMWPGDGGRYIGSATGVVNRDEESGVLNVGTYRQMIQSENKTGLYTSPGKDFRLTMQKQWEKGEAMPAAASYGTPPNIYAASTLSYGFDVNEYEVAGSISGEPVKLTEGKVTGLPIPAEAEIVVEGKLYPNDTLPEGPFGEFTGYYGRPRDDTPVFTIEAVHHRDDPILTSALMAGPGNDQKYLHSIGRSVRTWNDFDNLGIPGIEAINQFRGGGPALTVVSIDKQYAGHVSQVASIAAQGPGNAYYAKMFVVVDDDVDPTDFEQVMWALCTRFTPENDMDILTDTWGTPLDPSNNPPAARKYSSKVLIDATKHKDYDKHTEQTAISSDMYERIADRWSELGIDHELTPPLLFAEDSSGVVTGGASTDTEEEPEDIGM